MEQHKLRYLNGLIKRKEEEKGASRFDQLREYLGVLDELEDQARGYYADPVALEKNDFLEMLLLDGCFIIELFREAAWSDYRHETEMDPLFKADWVEITLGRDLMLLDNQIHSLFWSIYVLLLVTCLTHSSLFIRPWLFSRYMGPLEDDIALLSISNLAIRPLFLPIPPLQGRRPKPESLSDFKHLLDLVRKFMLVEEILEMKDESALPPQQGQRALTESTSVSTKKYKYSAMELRNLGVRFKSVAKSKFYDITFENELLEIPVIHIEDGTEGRFQNLITCEEHYGQENKYIGDYMSFMDGLVNTPKDVELLRHHGIIECFMGDDEVIATMFNNMCKHRILSNF
ncbi:uncharacterized protein LOC116214434 [Punica granatum]|uniref:Uncharacterized protein LOC116214434 n=1 Tax=Punica granatum TaxID=22663 RepID=A0A6P8EFX7_PUNGR|nr:uncharacterized protein LOC116214434 [Punica granatum]